jgi:hypothetical protein
MNFNQFTTVLASTLGAITLLCSGAIAQCPTDDALEDNDTCGTASVVTAGSYPGLVTQGTMAAGGQDLDYYVVQAVPTGTILTVDLAFTHANGDIELRLYDDAACSNQIDSGTTSSDDESVSVNNGTGAAVDYYIKVDQWGDWTCNDYTMTISTVLDPCVAAVDDGFEENDDCAAAAPITPGTYLDNFVSVTDEDFYSITVADGATLTIDALFIDDDGDLDIYLYDDLLVDCGVNGSNLDSSTSIDDNESLSVTNTTGAAVTYYIEMYCWGPGGSDCNTYDLIIDVTGNSPATPMCFGDGTTDIGGGPVACPCANESTLGAGEGCNSSLGYGAILTASGTNVVANDDMVFSVSQARSGQPSLLVQGSNLIANPFKDGVFCTGSPTERIEVVFTDGSGAGSTTSSIVTEGNITPGMTRYYQQWYRDPGGVSPCGTGSNFSQGLQVDWI